MNGFTEGPFRFDVDPTDPLLHCIWTDEGDVDQMPLLIARTCFALASEANAKLLAASYDLLSALVSAQKCLAMMIDHDAIKATSAMFAWANCVEAERQARAAIAKTR